MANLQETNVSTELTAGAIEATGGNSLNLEAIDTETRYLRNIYVETDTGVGTYSFSTTWSDGPQFPSNGHIYKAGSKVLFYYYMPTRNDQANWGGLYIEPQIQIDAGVWQSLGSCGFDGDVMCNNGASISHFDKQFVLDLGMATDFTLGFRFKCRSYGSTAQLNSHNDTLLSNTATVMPGLNGEQNYIHIIVEEYARLDGGV